MTEMDVVNSKVVLLNAATHLLRAITDLVTTAQKGLEKELESKQK